MATKSALITAVNGFISSIQSIANHRLSMLEIINVLFQTTITQTLVSGTNVFYYNLRYKKQGNLVHVDGYIVNKFTIAKSAVDILTISDSLVFGKTGNVVGYFGFTKTTGTPVEISIDADKIKLVGSMAPNQEIKINLTYQTND